MTFTVEGESAKNSLGMNITIWKVVGSDRLTYAETRYEPLAGFLARELTAREWLPSHQSVSMSRLAVAANGILGLIDKHGIGDDDHESEPLVNALRAALGKK
jgi:hypothetical protein